MPDGPAWADMPTEEPKSRPAPARASSTSISITELEKRLKELYALGAIPLSFKLRDEAGNPCEQCIAHYTENAEAAAESLIKLARTNPKVKQFLSTLVSGGVWTEVTITHIALVLPILIHHKPNVNVPPIFSVFLKDAQDTIEQDNVQHIHPMGDVPVEQEQQVSKPPDESFSL